MNECGWHIHILQEVKIWSTFSELSIYTSLGGDQENLNDMIGKLEMQLIETFTKQLNGKIQFRKSDDLLEMTLNFERDDSLSDSVTRFFTGDKHLLKTWR